MLNHVPTTKILGTAVVCLSLVLLLCSGCPEILQLQGEPGPQGPAGEPGPPGDAGSLGTRTGRVTNGLTGAGVGGVICALNPSYGETMIMTAEDGTFSRELPTGIYTITFEEDRFESLSLSVTVLGGAIEIADVDLEPVEPVVVTATVDGDSVPGGLMSATMHIDALDGSTVESMTWTLSSTATASLGGATTELDTITLSDDRAFKDRLLHILTEPPISEDDLPSTVQLPEGEFPGGLQSRFQIVGINPFALEEAALVTLTATVTTSSGTYSRDVEIHTQFAWKPSLGIRNVPVGIPVLLQSRRHVDEDADGFNDETGADVTAYDWALAIPGGSSAMLMDAITPNPYFVPDVSGRYLLTVTDTTRDPGTETVTLEIYAGTWRGVITGQDEA